MTAARARFYLGAFAAFCFLALSYLNYAYLSPGTLLNLDTHPLGYDLNDARTYVGALSRVEVAVYTGPYRVLDTLFPICLAAFLAMLLHECTRGWSIVSQLLLLVLPGAYLVMDLAENALLAQLVASDVGDLRAEAVNLASKFTVSKFVLLGATLLAIAAACFMGRAR